MTQKVLTTNKPYVSPGTYIGEDVQPGGANIAPQNRVPTFVGKGSRYIRERNSGLVRGYISDVQLEFSKSSPFTSALSIVSDGLQETASLVDGHGTEVRRDQWLFDPSNAASVIIADSAYVQGETYFLSYQGADPSAGDDIPVADIRLVSLIGTQIDQDQFKRNRDYYIDTALLSPEALKDDTGAIVHQINAKSTISPVVKVTGAGTGTVTLDPYAAFDHLYSRGYSLSVTSASGTLYTFTWTATPLSAGNNAAPAVPLAPAIPAPTFVVDSTDPQTQSVLLEYNLRLNFSGSFVVGDKFSFSAYGPSLVEVDGTLTNKNQFAAATSVVSDLDNAGAGLIGIDAEGYVGSSNLNVRAQVIAVDSGSVSATNPTASIKFTGNPADGTGVKIDNGRTGVSHVAKTFEFDTDHVQTIAGSTLVASPASAAVAASGTIAFSGSSNETPVDGALVTISDGVRTVTFEFDNDVQLGLPSATRVLIDTTVGSESAKTAANLVKAINSSSLRITATDLSSSNGNVGKIGLVSQVAGTVGNVAITTGFSYINPLSGSSILVAGMSNGADAAPDLAGTITNLIASINQADLGIFAAKDDSDANKINLTCGARLVFAGQPTDGDTFTANVGTGVTTFEFDNDSTVGAGNVPITIAATLGQTLTATALALETALAVSVASTASSLLVVPKLSRNVVLTESGTQTSVVPSVVDDILALTNGNVPLIPVNGLSNVVLSGFVGGTDAVNSPDHVVIAWGTSGDEFASGTAVLTESEAVDLYRGSKVSIAGSAASAARGTITLLSNPVDANSVTITDGIISAPIVFEFDNNSTHTAGSVGVLIGATAAATAANLATAIASSALQLTVTLSGASVLLTHKKTGTGPLGVYNSPIVKSGTAIQVVGLAGGKSNFVVGDKFSFAIKAPRSFTTALDDRKITLTAQQVGLSNATLVDPRYVRFIYASNTPEGGFGLVESFAADNGYFMLPGQIRLAVRNTAGSNRFVVGDKFQATHVNNGKIRWDLDAKSVDTFTVNDVLTDRNGSVTGTFGGYYLSLSNKPYPASVKVQIGSTVTSDWAYISGTTFIYLLTSDLAALAEGVTVSYMYGGSEPALGASYYLTAQYKRPVSSYNRPILFYDRASALEFLAPITTDNDLAIAADLAFSQVNAPLAIATVQVLDGDDDGVFSPADIDAALAGTADVNFATDIVPVRLYSFWSKFLAFNVQACDPFAKREHIQYFGAPIGTPVGDASTPDSLVFIAKNTLQIFGQSYAHGTRILVGPRTARKTITLSDGTITTVTLDGSFVAAAVASMVAGLPNYSVTLLKQSLLGFDYIETFGNSINERLGEAGAIYFSDAGSGVYVYQEDQTVDKYAAEFHEILPMRTKQDVTRIVRSELDSTAIGMVPDTRGDATATISARIMQVLINLVNRGITAPYQDENGNARTINSGDVKVFMDDNDPTLYNFFYTFYTRFAIKRLFGLYSVNKTIN